MSKDKKEKSLRLGRKFGRYVGSIEQIFNWSSKGEMKCPDCRRNAEKCGEDRYHCPKHPKYFRFVVMIMDPDDAIRDWYCRSDRRNVFDSEFCELLNSNYPYYGIIPEEIEWESVAETLERDSREEHEAFVFMVRNVPWECRGYLEKMSFYNVDKLFEVLSAQKCKIEYFTPVDLQCSLLEESSGITFRRP